jgi:hypothetical protein
VGFLQAPSKNVRGEANDNLFPYLEGLLEEERMPFMEYVEGPPDAYKVKAFVQTD